MCLISVKKVILSKQVLYLKLNDSLKQGKYCSWRTQLIDFGYRDHYDFRSSRSYHFIPRLYSVGS